MTVPLPMSAGVIGWPVAHSKSPLIHRFWLSKLGIDGDYGRFPVHPGKLGEAIRALPALGMRGVNVTVPHKVAVMEFLDEIDLLAADVGAVNTIVVNDGKLTGHNTDVAGFHAGLGPVLESIPHRPNHTTLTVLIGAGGAARAVMVAMGRNADVTVFARDKSKADALSNELGVGSAYGYSSALSSLRKESYEPDDGRFSYVIVNASTLGMHGHPPVPINLDNYPQDTIVYDLVYAPLETPLLAAARARGLRTIDGLRMLVGQAAAAFELFFGQPAPRQHDAELRALLTA